MDVFCRAVNWDLRVLGLAGPAWTRKSKSNFKGLFPALVFRLRFAWYWVLSLKHSLKNAVCYRKDKPVGTVSAPLCFQGYYWNLYMYEKGGQYTLEDEGTETFS